MSAKAETRSRIGVFTLGELSKVVADLVENYPADTPVIVDPADEPPVIAECWDISVGYFIQITARDPKHPYNANRKDICE